MQKITEQLISYIAPGAPATRRPAEGNEPFLRPEIGFTPKWYRQKLDIDFGEEWHTNPDYRRDAIIAMRAELKKRFPGLNIGRSENKNEPLDLLTGTYGACTIAGIYGIPVLYAQDNWPNCAHQYLSDDEVDNLTPPNLDTNPFLLQLMSQVYRITVLEGRVEGFINWQGILNNAQRLRGQQLFSDMIENPQRTRHLFDCVCTTMIEAAQMLHQKQRETGVEVKFFTISNCLVNMISPQHYADLLLPYDIQIAETYGTIGIHNCAWNADPYMEHYALIPNISYIDMGLESNLAQAKKLMPDARRALMYTPMELTYKKANEIEADLNKIACEYGPCDLVFADIDVDTPDQRVIEVVRICDRIFCN